MRNEAHIKRLKRGVIVWNQWKMRHDEYLDLRGVELCGAMLSGIDLSRVDLRDADLSRANLSRANLSGANLRGTKLSDTQLTEANLSRVFLAGVDLSAFNLRGANLSWANLSWANLNKADLEGANFIGAKLDGAQLRGTNLSWANLNRANLNETDVSGSNVSHADLSDAELTSVNLWGANLTGANLSRANLSRANLSFTNLGGATMSGADLSRAILIETNFTKAILTDCRIYGVAAWDVQLQDTKQLNLIVTKINQPIITVDNLEVAQFIYLLLNNKKIRDVIDTITSKVVLILGRFTLEKKIVLDAIKDKLREYNYLPILFDFDKPASQTVAETIRILAHLSRFIIVDLTDPRSVPAELETFVPHCLVPVQPLLEVPSVVLEENIKGKHVIEESAVKGIEYTLFRSLQLYPWVLPIVRYQDSVELFSSLKERVIDPAEQKAQELARQK